MIKELTTKLQSCYQARGWFDSAIDAKNDEIKRGRALHQTAQDRIRVLEAEIAAIKEEATARLVMPVGEHIAHCMADRGSGPCEYVPPPGMILMPDEPRIAAPGVVPSRDVPKEDPFKVASSGLTGDSIGDPRWLIELTPPPFFPLSLSRSPGNPVLPLPSSS